MEFEKIVIIGATSLMAEHCARLWIKNAPKELILVGRDSEKLAVIASDLQVRCATTIVKTLTIDFLNPTAIKSLANSLHEDGPIDLVLIAHGTLPDQIQCQDNLLTNQDALEINGISPVIFAEAFVEKMENKDAGTIAIIGSVAGDRGRKSNYVYGAAKGLVTRYAQGLQHRLAKTKVNVILIKPGPTDTPMTAEYKLRGMKLASVESVAKDIVEGINQQRKVIYTPSKWKIIMLVIQHLPGFIFNKLEV